MISRIWHGWTTPENADRYESLLKTGSRVSRKIRIQRIATARA
jgi:hypothetical protein